MRFEVGDNLSELLSVITVGFLVAYLLIKASTLLSEHTYRMAALQKIGASPCLSEFPKPVKKTKSHSEFEPYRIPD